MQISEVKFHQQPYFQWRSVFCCCDIISNWYQSSICFRCTCQYNMNFCIFQKLLNLIIYFWGWFIILFTLWKFALFSAKVREHLLEFSRVSTQKQVKIIKFYFNFEFIELVIQVYNALRIVINLDQVESSGFVKISWNILKCPEENKVFFYSRERPISTFSIICFREEHKMNFLIIFWKHHLNIGKAINS